MALAITSFAITLGAVAVLRSGSLDEKDAAVALTLNDRAFLTRGTAIYARECASCHGVELEGEPDWKERRPDGKLPAPPHDANGHTWHHSGAQLFELVKNGLPREIAGKPYLTDMPAFGRKLTDADIAAALGYIKSRWPAGIQAQHDALNARLAAAAATLRR